MFFYLSPIHPVECEPLVLMEFVQGEPIDSPGGSLLRSVEVSGAVVETSDYIALTTADMQSVLSGASSGRDIVKAVAALLQSRQIPCMAYIGEEDEAEPWLEPDTLWCPRDFFRVQALCFSPHKPARTKDELLKALLDPQED